MAKKVRDVPAEQEYNDAILERGVGTESDTATHENGAGPTDADAAEMAYLADAAEMAHLAADADSAEQPPGEAPPPAEQKGKSVAAKADDWRRIMSVRASAAHDAMVGMLRLANAKIYKWDAEQEAKVCDTLAADVESVRKALSAARLAAEAPAVMGRGGKRSRQYSLGV